MRRARCNPGAAPALTDTYGLRSVCGSAGCVATASRLGGAPVGQPTMTFDQVGGRWVAVALSSDQCRNAPAEFWQVFTLQSRPDGTLTGDYTAVSANACVERRSVTFTRTGDIDVNRLPDPGRQPPRVASPAEALHGHYHATRSFSNGLPQDQGYSGFMTSCLRTGDRCMSYFHDPTMYAPLVFAGGAWTLQFAGDGEVPELRRFHAGDDHRALSDASITAESDHAAHRAWSSASRPGRARSTRTSTKHSRALAISAIGANRACRR